MPQSFLDDEQSLRVSHLYSPSIDALPPPPPLLFCPSLEDETRRQTEAWGASGGTGWARGKGRVETRTSVGHVRGSLPFGVASAADRSPQVLVSAQDLTRSSQSVQRRRLRAVKASGCTRQALDGRDVGYSRSSLCRRPCHHVVPYLVLYPDRQLARPLRRHHRVIPLHQAFSCDATTRPSTLAQEAE